LIAILGPGLVAAMAGDDAGGIATYSAVGAAYGYQLLWVMLVITVSLAVVQETAARLGAATGRGMLDLVRERYGITWALFMVAVVLVANTGIILAQFAGIGAAAELFGISRYLAIPVSAAALWYSVTAGSYASVEKLFVAMTLVFFAYPVTAILAQPDWGEVARGAFIPSLQREPEFIMLFVALVGTTITPFMSLFQQSSVVEKGVARRHYGPERMDAYVGSIFSNFVAITIIIATGATLHVAGHTEIESAADAANVLRPVAGDAAQALFAFGLLGASLLAAGILPLTTAYSVSEAFGFPKGVGLDFRRAPTFFGVFTALIVFGAAVALIPNMPLIDVLVWVQTLNGVLLPILLVFQLLLVNDRRLVGTLANTRLYNVLGWGTVIFVTTAVVALLGTEALGFLGIDVFGSLSPV
jgi:NRAMP (natural resistance-associated macrophage protein)-like metal ion transporter